MKKQLFTVALCFTFFGLLPLNTISATVLTSSYQKITTDNQSFNLEDFSKMTVQEYTLRTGKKMSFVEKLAFKVAQKKAKMMRKADGAGGNTLSLLSVILGGAGLLFLLIGSSGLALLGLLAGIAGFVLGLIGLKKEDSHAMAIIGLICGGIVVLIFLYAILIVASA